MSPVVWIIAGAIVLAACCVNKKGTNMGSSGGQQKVFRIDHSHFLGADEYECSACGARFRKQSMVCPRCGARFDGTRKDDTEFDEEMMEAEDWDEEEGR